MEENIAWEKMVVPAAWLAAGLGISVWLVYLDYRRRLPPEGQPTVPGPGRGLLDAGMGLAALGLGIRLISGTDKGWPAVACSLSALTGTALVVLHVTRKLTLVFKDDGGGRRRKERSE